MSREQTRQILVDWAMRLNSQAAEWDLETVKHLVVLNAAGVAGAATLLASAAAADKLWIARAMIGYTAGVILAVGNLHLAARSFNIFSSEIADRARTVANDPNAKLDGIFRDPEQGRKTNWFGQGVGWLSAVCAFGSTVTLACVLMR